MNIDFLKEKNKNDLFLNTRKLVKNINEEVDPFLRLKLHGEIVTSFEKVLKEILKIGISLEQYIEVEQKIKNKINKHIPINIMYKIKNLDKLMILEDIFILIEGYLISDYFNINSNFFNDCFNLLQKNHIPVGLSEDVFLVVDFEDFRNECSHLLSENLSKKEIQFKEHIFSIQEKIIETPYFSKCGLKPKGLNLNFIQAKKIEQVNKNLKSIHLYNITNEEIYRLNKVQQKQTLENPIFTDTERFFNYQLKPLLLFKMKEYNIQLDDKAFWQLQYFFVEIYPSLIYSSEGLHMKFFEIFEEGHIPCGYIKRSNTFRLY